MDSASVVFQQIPIWYSLGVSIAGIFGNMLTVGVCCSKRLRKTPTFVFMAFLVAADTSPLIIMATNRILRNVYGYPLIETTSLIGCKVQSILTYVMTQSSAFLLVSITVERFMSVKLKLWRTVYFSSKKAAMISVGIILFFTLLHIHLSVTLVPVKMINGTLIFGGCSSSIPMKQFWGQSHTYLFSMIPFAILMFFDILLLREVTKSSKIQVHTGTVTNKTTEKRRSLTITVLILALLFFILTGPSAVGSGYFQPILESSQRTLLGYLNALSTTYHACKFVAFMVSNKEFSKEFKVLVYKIAGIKRNKIMTTTGGNTNGMSMAANEQHGSKSIL